MPYPSFNQTPYYRELTGVTDVQDIIDELATILPAIGWSDLGSNTFKSVPNSEGQFIQLAFTRVDASRLQCVMTDDLSRTFPSGQAMELDITGTVTVDFCYGPSYLYFQSSANISGIPQFMLACIMTFNPEPQDSSTGYVYCSSGFDQAQSGSGTSLYGCSFNFNTSQYDTAFSNSRVMSPVAGLGAGSDPIICKTPAGFARWFPAVGLGIDSDGAVHVRGRIPNIVLVQGTGIVSAGNIRSIPVDGATSSPFLVLRARSDSPFAFLAARLPQPT